MENESLEIYEGFLNHDNFRNGQGKEYDELGVVIKSGIYKDGDLIYSDK